MNDEMITIGEQLRTQDNRCTQNPIFYVQEKIREGALKPDYGDGNHWIDMESGEYEEVEPDTPGSEEFGYKDRWETVMVALTEKGCKEHLRLNRHNYAGEVRIYAGSLYRCPEMIAIRDALIALAPPASQPAARG